MKRRILGASLGLLALFMNPAIGCSSSEEPSWSFSETDMRTALAGTYVGNYGNTTETVTLTLDEATSSSSSSTQSVSGPRLQCGNRSFIRPAAACMQGMSSMSVSGTITSSEGTIASSAVTGQFNDYSSDLSSGNLSLTLADGSTLSATFSEGRFVLWQYYPLTGTMMSLTLARQ